MTKIKKYLVLIFFPLFTFSCVSNTPHLRMYGLVTDEVEGRFFFFPPTVWETQKGIKLEMDINFRDTLLMPTLVNVGITIKGKRPAKVSSIVFQGDTRAFPLSGGKGLMIRQDKNYLRVSGSFSYDEFFQMIKSESITMTVTVDGTAYTGIPSKDFLTLQQEFNFIDN
jgi:hypothetical protein